MDNLMKSRTIQKLVLITSLTLSATAFADDAAVLSKIEKLKAEINQLQAQLKNPVVEKNEQSTSSSDDEVTFRESASSSNLTLAQRFEGLSLSAGLGIVGNKTYNKETGVGDHIDDGVDVDSNLGSVKAIARVDITYLKAINDNFLIGLGASYDFNDIKSTQNSPADDKGEYYGLATPTILKLKNHFSIYVQPTYVIREGTAVFGKIGYHHVDSSYEDKYNSNYETGPTKQGLHGVGLGLGLETFMTENIFLKVEGNYVHYLTESSISTNTFDDSYKVELKSDQAEGVISLGYKF